MVNGCDHTLSFDITETDRACGFTGERAGQLPAGNGRSASGAADGATPSCGGPPLNLVTPDSWMSQPCAASLRAIGDAAGCSIKLAVPVER